MQLQRLGSNNGAHLGTHLDSSLATGLTARFSASFDLLEVATFLRLLCQEQVVILWRRSGLLRQ